MLEGYTADADTELQRGYAYERQFRYMRTQDVNSDQQRKRTVRHNKQRMIDFGAGDLYKNIYITSNISTRAADSDDVGIRVVELLNRGAARQEFVPSGVQHRLQLR